MAALSRFPAWQKEAPDVRQPWPHRQGNVPLDLDGPDGARPGEFRRNFVSLACDARGRLMRGDADTDTPQACPPIFKEPPMAAGPEFMRPMRATEIAAVEALLQTAFGGPQEAALVRALRAEGRMELEMVLPWGEGVAGYLALSRLVAPEGWLALAPVAIAPPWQGQRWGTRLVTAVRRLTEIKGQTVVVLGKPSFYGRCGFSSSRAAGLTSPYPLQNTLISGPRTDSPTDNPSQTLIYPTAFQGV